ncbi:MAG: type I restriction enzyme HsdR N-terminal domain-containing protein [Anaerovoracaceae bacterium]|nr:type I restriction enzyme HsdR N-terminal domain-containing protein [Anaerovoracaceae bacterium]
MESKERIKEWAEGLEELKESVGNEESTKTAMVMPLFQMLGYNVFDPKEFVPEYTADVGSKKKEKVDYAIMKDGKPLIFIECKPHYEDLIKHSPQLIKYYNSTVEAKFGILTNGIMYKFFADLENSNIMDKTPFLTIDMLNLKDRDLVELEKFSRENLDVDTILSSAEELKYTRLIKEWIADEVANPSAAFVKLAIADIHDGVKSQKVIEQFTPLVKRALVQYINDSMNSRIQNALKGQSDDTVEIEERDTSKNEPQSASNENKISTTIEEIEGYGVVKSVLRHIVDSSRITYRDQETYFGILLDDNNRKWICRLYLNGGKKHITVSDKEKKPVRYDIESIDDIYKYENEIIAACNKYL